MDAADSASLQLAVASPDPVQSGSELFFQVILANNGNVNWEAGRYYFEVQIYDAGKNYLNKTKRILGEKDVPPGETALAFIPFLVPENYAGPYFYRIFMTHREQRIFEGNFTYFSVTPLPPQPPKEKPVTFGGNAILSYRTFSPDNRKDVANLSVNSVGQIHGRSMVFNLNSQFSKPLHTKIIQVLLTYYGPIATLNFGDVQPDFSALSLANFGARGIWIQLPFNRFSTEIVGAQSVFKVSGSSSPARAGTFARYMIGAQQTALLPWNFSLSANYVKVFDDKNSLSADPRDSEFRGIDPKEVKNDVLSGKISWKGFSERLVVDAEYAQSDFEENTLGTVLKTASEKGTAIQVGSNYKGKKFSWRGSVRRTDPSFRALAAPSVAADRLSLDLGMIYTQPLKRSSLSANLNLNQFTDNVKNDPKKITTTQTTIALGSSLANPKPWPGISLFISLNQGQDKEKTALDNQTQTVGVNIQQPIGGKTNLSVGIQQSQFKDNLKKSADLTTQSQSLNLTTSFIKRVNLSLGGTISKTDSQATKTTPAGSLTSNSYSASINWTVIEDRLIAQIWMTMGTREGTSGGTKQDTKEQSQNAELTYQLFKKLAVTLGGTKNRTDDGLDPKKKFRGDDLKWAAHLQFLRGLYRNYFFCYIYHWEKKIDMDYTDKKKISGGIYGFFPPKREIEDV